MAFTVTEKPLDRTGSSEQYERTYVVKSDSTIEADAALAALLAAAPIMLHSLPRDDKSAKVEEIKEGLTYEGTVTWIKKEESGDCSFTFDISGEQSHITHSLSTVVKYPLAAAPDCKQAIGVTPDGVQGTDVLIPRITRNVKKTFDLADIDPSYIDGLEGLVGKTNDASFSVMGSTYAAGEALFSGASGGLAADSDKFEISFVFAISKNETGLVIGDITGIAKDGWDYLWVMYETEEDAVTKRLVEIPAYVYVERVFERADFSPLAVCAS